MSSSETTFALIVPRSSKVLSRSILPISLRSVVCASCEIANTKSVMAATALLVGLVPKISLAVAWFAYLSFVSLGWPFMSFQWDTLLLEVSFTAFFLVPWRLWDRPSALRDPHPLARWALWWLLFRLVFRSAVVKLASGDTTWTDLTALTFHYWTQPLPNPIAWYANLLPLWFQKLSCFLMFVVELGHHGAGWRRARPSGS